MEWTNRLGRNWISSRNAQRVMQLRHRSVREVNQNANFVVWSLAYIRDLRSREERDTDSVDELLREDQPVQE